VCVYKAALIGIEEPESVGDNKTDNKDEETESEKEKEKFNQAARTVTW
jgi:hypothetical protein